MRSVVVLLLVGLSAAPAAFAGEAREEFEQAAEELSFFALDDFLYDRDFTARVPANDARQYRETVDRLFRGQVRADGPFVLNAMRPQPSPTEVRVLLGHDDPKVRTLAIAWLFARQGQQALPLLSEHVNDTAETFPGLQLVASIALPAKVRTENRTVGQVARGMVDFYMERAGFYYGVEGRNEHPGFDQYWEQRRDREHCLSWFAVQLDRATQGMSPLRRNAESKARRVRYEIDRLSPVEREIALLALFAGKTELRNVVSEQDLLFAGRRLGPERLLRVLRGESIVDDPDLPHYQERIRDFVLEHAVELLRPEDAPWLLTQGEATRSVAWFLAAAELQPRAASGTVRRAFEVCRFHGDERTRAATTLWRLAGPANDDFVVEWFWSDTEPKLGRAPYRASFIDFLTRRFQPEDRSLLGRLVRDKRFEELDWQTLESLIHGLNRNLLHPIVPPREIETTRHPIGKSHFHGMIERAREQYPKETENLLTTMDVWRNRVRNRMADWGPAAE